MKRKLIEQISGIRERIAESPKLKKAMAKPFGQRVMHLIEISMLKIKKRIEQWHWWQSCSTRKRILTVCLIGFAFGICLLAVGSCSDRVSGIWWGRFYVGLDQREFGLFQISFTERKGGRYKVNIHMDLKDEDWIAGHDPCGGALHDLNANGTIEVRLVDNDENKVWVIAPGKVFTTSTQHFNITCKGELKGDTMEGTFSVDNAGATGFPSFGSFTAQKLH